MSMDTEEKKIDLIEDQRWYNIDDNMISAIIIPDKDIIPGAKNLKPAFIIFDNYKLILKHACLYLNNIFCYQIKFLV